jgi:uncharacterized membrane protein
MTTSPKQHRDVGGSHGPGRNGPGAAAIRENVQRISELEGAAKSKVSLSERLSKAATDFAGTLRFVFAHVALFAGWASWNLFLEERWRFDPYPFGLLTMIVSMEGVLLATFVLITQNRLMAHGERRDHLALQVNLLTEQELTMVLRMLRQLCERAGVEPLSEDQRRVEELVQETNVYDVMKQLEIELPADRPDSAGDASRGR